jgi:protein-arginine kinase activator protein McsA
MKYATETAKPAKMALVLPHGAEGGKSERRVCNLCKDTYVSHTKFERFCPNCRKDSQVYHFAEWLSAS